MAQFRQKKGSEPEARPDGHIRLSQIVTTFGPGAMVDLVDHAVLVAGLDFWEYSKYDGHRAIEEPRLCDHLVGRYKVNLSPTGPFRTPPIGKNDAPTPWSGVPVVEFPSWFVCQGCAALVRAGDGLEKKGARWEHSCPDRKKPSRTVPVRFVGACRRGHLQDYPWRYFAHEDGKCATGTLRLEEGRTGDFSQIGVRCTCGQGRKLSMATMAEMRPRCEGYRPWLGRDGREACDEKLHLLVRTASNAYFPHVQSALSIPDPDAELDDDVRATWTALQNIKDVGGLQTLRDIAPAIVAKVARYEAQAVVDAIERERLGKRAERAPLRVAELRRFVAAPEQLPLTPPEDATFLAERTTVPQGFAGRVARVVLAHKLREVRALIGFTRLEPATMDAQGELDLEVELSRLTLHGTWTPATEVWGEGLFLELDEEAVRAWEERPSVKARRDELHAGHRAWVRHLLERAPDRKEPPFLGTRFYLLHTLSHMLLTAIGMECGYAASAIRERIYCGPTETEPTPMAAILLSTGTSGSEGTLGGLVDQGRRLGHHLRRAIEDSTLCSNDPVCARHSPADDPAERYLEGAACHGCLFLPECSCERFNRYLDRALVVPTMGHDAQLAFFGPPA